MSDCEKPPETPPVVCDFDDYTESGDRKDGKNGGRRPMRFPYTFTAKIAQFPLRYYFDNQWIWKYYFVAVVCCIPVFWKISRLSNSDENKAKWAAIHEKERAEHAHHDDDHDE